MKDVTVLKNVFEESGTLEFIEGIAKEMKSSIAQAYSYEDAHLLQDSMHFSYQESGYLLPYNFNQDAQKQICDGAFN